MGELTKYFALIKKGLVETVVVADSNFISQVKTKYDHIIDVTNDIKRPVPGDSYYPDTEAFISNYEDTHFIPVISNSEHLKNGTEEGFEPFEISKYSVSYKDGVITIGCKSYSAIGMLDTLHKLLIEKHKTTTYFTALKDGPTHGKFAVTWNDAKNIYERLKKVRLQ